MSAESAVEPTSSKVGNPALQILVITICIAASIYAEILNVYLLSPLVVVASLPAVYLAVRGNAWWAAAQTALPVGLTIASFIIANR